MISLLFQRGSGREESYRVKAEDYELRLNSVKFNVADVGRRPIYRTVVINFY